MFSRRSDAVVGLSGFKQRGCGAQDMEREKMCPDSVGEGVDRSILRRWRRSSSPVAEVTRVYELGGGDGCFLMESQAQLL